MSIEYRVVNGVVSYFPVSAHEIFSNIHSYHKTGIDLFAGLVITLYGARGIASALQNASNDLWHIPKNKRPDFWHSQYRNIGIILFGGGGMIITTVLLSYTNNISSKGLFFKLLVTLFALILNILVFTMVFRMATSKVIKTKWLFTGAILAGVFWQILQSFGSFLVLHQLKQSSELYGVFALVLGMIFWIYLQAEVTLYAMEANIVQRQILWPRDLLESDDK
jgi:YihY family inner membrane protein